LRGGGAHLRITLMPMTTTHALLPIAAAVAVAGRPVPWRLVAIAAVAAAAPDVDGLFKHFLGVPPNSIYGHRGAAHSLFVALAAGLLATFFHRRLGVRPLTAGVVVAAAMASHGLLDMMTDSGLGVAYLWPVSSNRLFADWRWIHSSPVQLRHIRLDGWFRFKSEVLQLILPMFGLAIAIRGTRALLRRKIST
jgi:inner membrane protein